MGNLTGDSKNALKELFVLGTNDTQILR